MRFFHIGSKSERAFSEGCLLSHNSFDVWSDGRSLLVSQTYPSVDTDTVRPVVKNSCRDDPAWLLLLIRTE